MVLQAPCPDFGDVMFNLVVADDDARSLAILCEQIGSGTLADMFFVETISDGEQVLARLSGHNPPDIVLMDIDFGEGKPNGIELVERMSLMGSHAQVIYVTGRIEFCTQVYRTDHVYFLVKPVRQNELENALKRACDRVIQRESELIALSTRTKTVLVHPHDIMFLESKRRKVLVHTCDAVHETYATLDKVFRLLPEPFVRCHKSYLVNMDYIVELQTDHILLRTGETVPVSQSRRKDTRDTLLRYLGNGF